MIEKFFPNLIAIWPQFLQAIWETIYMTFFFINNRRNFRISYRHRTDNYSKRRDQRRQFHIQYRR
ncbi:hypothetical protein Q757_06395 [Oenococcus alcoholitolerans]|uniref:Uncharacterized protein n=1 Tax=Oenococcus alcoholitolerans TaxID=931074 RepID=A0ABR4XQB9_9LACO|nr:hypothetical protein Q757_06395 [Oenococcus alcoholitolerans]